MRTLVMGDIHGAYKALVQCLERSKFDKEKDTLIQLGDVADGWSEVPECVEELLSIKNLISIKGNHDDWAWQWMKYGIANPMWLSQGGQATFDAYSHFHYDLIEKHYERFFNKQHNYYIDDDNRGYVHGGYSDLRGLGHEESQTTYFWDRGLVKAAMSGEGVYKSQGIVPKLLRAHKEVFIGHTSTVAWGTDEPIHASNLYNLDTGAGFSGKLTIMDVETKEYWQSDPVQELYPNEAGRGKFLNKWKMKKK